MMLSLSTSLRTYPFVLLFQIRNGKATAILAVAYDKDKIRKSTDASSKRDSYTIYRPNTGFQVSRVAHSIRHLKICEARWCNICFVLLQLRQETLSELEKKYRKVEAADAEKPWKEQFDTSENTCSHAYWYVGEFFNRILLFPCIAA